MNLGRPWVTVDPDARTQQSRQDGASWRIHTIITHHGHSHGHGHTHGPVHGAGTAASTRALTWSLVLTVIILIAEGVGGWLSNSLALLADAGHVLTDAGALGLSLFVAWLARQPGSGAKTFGYLRWEILAALINGATLLLISVWIVIEAICASGTGAGCPAV